MLPQSKFLLETLDLQHFVGYGIPNLKSLQFNTYGSRMRPDDGRVVSNFIVQALKGEDIKIEIDDYIRTATTG